ncbi:selenocysteine lyase [Fusarium heterosporum]|uniref:Selenocysteine lyase n=1 Tax=Fusarium heterosporum TaxID=42747 RepID=A0A8H5T236_FUSHE|nr:selenocysteine lyase [Fusarium heterosporum]
MAINRRLPQLAVEAVRRQFPGLTKGSICLNNGAGSLVYRGAIESITKTMSHPHMNLRGQDSNSMVDVKKRAAQYARIASFVNANPDEIAFGPSTTGLLRTLTDSLRPNLNADSEMIVSVLCHEAGITAWRSLAKSLGIVIKWWTPPTNKGHTTDPKLTLDSLRPLLSPKTRLVCCGHVSNITGTIEPIKQIADLVHSIPGAMFCVDGVAMAPHRPVDVKLLDVDFYIFSWYKVFGPHIAQIYARRKVQQRFLSNLNHYFFNANALSIKLGLGNHCIELEHAVVPIIDYLEDQVGWESIIAHEQAITGYLLEYLTSNPGLYTVYGSQTADPDARVSLVSFSANGLSSDRVAQEIHETSTCRLISGDCWSPRTVYDVLGRGDDGIIRVSLVHYNTMDEMRDFTQTLDQAVRNLTHQEMQVASAHG